MVEPNMYGGNSGHFQIKFFNKLLSNHNSSFSTIIMCHDIVKELINNYKSLKTDILIMPKAIY